MSLDPEMFKFLNVKLMLAEQREGPLSAVTAASVAGS